MATKNDKKLKPALGSQAGHTYRSEIYGYSNVLWPEDAQFFGQGLKGGFQVYDEIARDGKVASALIKRKQKLIGREWKLEAPLNATKKEQEATDWIREHLSSIKFDKICVDLLDAIHYGIAYSEILWDYAGDKVVINTIKPRVKHAFVFDRNEKLRLLQNSADMSGEEVSERKFIVHKYRDDDRRPYGLGLGYELFWPSQFKRRGVAYWQKFLDKWANPVPVGKVLPGTSEADRAQLVNYLQTVNESSSFVINIGEEVETFESSRSGTAEYEPWKRAWDEEILLIVLGETLTSMVGNHGSYAAAKTHSDILDDLIDMDSDLLSGTLNETLISWLVDFNFGGCRPPRIWWELPADELAEEELAIKRAERRKAELELYAQQKELGFEPVDADWISKSQGQEMHEIKAALQSKADVLKFPISKKKSASFD